MNAPSTTDDDRTITDDADSAEEVGATEVPILSITPAALEIVAGVLATEPDPESLGLRVEITGTAGAEFSYDLAFETVDESADDIVVEARDGLTVMVPEDTVERLRGAVLDVGSAGGGGLVIRNPNRPNPLAGIELDRSGDLASQVSQLLEEVINPSLAAHGGFATLMGVDDDNKVFVSLGGGCQGCAMSRMTLTEGIQRQLSEAIPEIGEVVDVTDHASGDNPFY